MERFDNTGAREYAPHRLPLNANASPVDDPHMLPPGRTSFHEVRLDHRLYIPRRHRMQIENVGKRDAVGLVAQNQSVPAAVKYTASGWWNTMALTLASGSIIMPSVSSTPISCGRTKCQMPC